MFRPIQKCFVTIYKIRIWKIERTSSSEFMFFMRICWKFMSSDLFALYNIVWKSVFFFSSLFRFISLTTKYCKLFVGYHICMKNFYCFHLYLRMFGSRINWYMERVELLNIFSNCKFADAYFVCFEMKWNEWLD